MNTTSTARDWSPKQVPARHADTTADIHRTIAWIYGALGVGVWVALAFGGVWFVHQMTRSKESCGGQIEARTAMPKGQTAGPRNALQLLTGTGRCQ